MSEVNAALGRPETLSPAELRDEWQKVTRTTVPKVSPKLLRLAPAWELQAKAYGGHSRATTRVLDPLARGITRTSPARAGMRLVREWQGTVHVVTVSDDTVIWQGKAYRSLSEVARAITGTRWSGPAFFGLKKRAA